MDKAPCVFCGVESDFQNGFNVPGSHFPSPWYACPECGHYVFGEDISLDWKGSKSEEAFKIACLVREKQLASNRVFYGVFGDDFQPTERNVAKHVNMWWRKGELLAEFPKATELIDRVLLNLSRLVRHPMETIRIKAADKPFVSFCPPNTLRDAWYYLKALGLVEDLASTPSEAVLTITPKGWERISELQSGRVDSKQAFVAMWFHPSTEEMETAYKDAIDKAGFDPRIIKNVEHNNKICDEIVAEIRKSRFVVADFTAGCCNACAECKDKDTCGDKVRPRGGVYFEAGFAIGLGIPVIWTVREDQIKQIHFDTRQYNHIVYKDDKDLITKLGNRIRATIH